MPPHVTAPLPGGLYRHYKGRHYQVLALAHHSETEEALVVYRALYGNFGVWVRPLAMFANTVNVDGNHVARFTLIGDGTGAVNQPMTL